MATFLLVVVGVIGGLLLAFTVYAALTGLLGVLTDRRSELPSVHLGEHMHLGEHSWFHHSFGVHHH